MKKEITHIDRGEKKELPNNQRKDSWNQAIKMIEHENRLISCSDSFLPYVSDKTKKSEEIFVCYLCFCLSLSRI